MLKKNKEKWVKILEITEELWKKMMQEALNGVIILLESTEKLLQNGGNKEICAGLYTYALEEYGKILLLKQYSPSSGKVGIKYKNEFRDHKAKFGIALKSLPDECTTLHKGSFSRRNFSNNFDIDKIADFEARMAIFYSDFKDSGDGIKPVPPVDENCLKNAISKFKTIVLGTTIPS